MKNRVIILTVFLAFTIFIFSLVGCNIRDFDDDDNDYIGATVAGSGSISGQVTASGTITTLILDEPGKTGTSQAIRPAVVVADAEVWLQGNFKNKVKTDSSGKFTLTNVPFGTDNRVVASISVTIGGKRKYYKVRSSKSVSPSTGGTVTGGSRSITGNLYDEATKAPIVGAQVSIAGTTTKTVTDANGYFEFRNLPLGTYNLVVARDGYMQKTFTGIVVTN